MFPCRRYEDPFTLASLVLLAELAKTVHPQIRIYQTKLAVWPYLPPLNGSLVDQLEAIVDFWFVSGAPLAAVV